MFMCFFNLLLNAIIATIVYLCSRKERIEKAVQIMSFMLRVNAVLLMAFMFTMTATAQDGDNPSGGG